MRTETQGREHFYAWEQLFPTRNLEALTSFLGHIYFCIVCPWDISSVYS